MGLPLSHNPMYHITLLVTQNGTNGGLCTSVFFFFNFTLIKLSSLIFLGRIFVVFVMSDFTHRTGHVQLADHSQVKAQFCKIVELAKSNVILAYLILQKVLHPFLNYLSLLGEVQPPYTQLHVLHKICFSPLNISFNLPSFGLNSFSCT